MIFNSTRFAAFAALSLLAAVPGTRAQSPDTAMTRLRPIGAPTAADQYHETSVRRVSGDQGSEVRQTVMLQQFDAPQLPGSMQLPQGFSSPPPMSPPNMVVPSQPSMAPPTQGAMAPPTQGSMAPPMQGLPGNLAPVPMSQAPMSQTPMNQPMMNQPPVGQSVLVPGNGDFTPLTQPRLNDEFATIDNCCCVTAPSDYVAETGWGECCTPVAYQQPQPQAYVTPPPTIAGPTIAGPVIAAPTVAAPGVVPEAPRSRRPAPRVDQFWSGSKSGRGGPGSRRPTGCLRAGTTRSKLDPIHLSITGKGRDRATARATWLAIGSGRFRVQAPSRYLRQNLAAWVEPRCRLRSRVRRRVCRWPETRPSTRARR